MSSFFGPSPAAMERVQALKERWRVFQSRGVASSPEFRFLHAQESAWRDFLATWESDPESALPRLQEIEADADTVRRYVDTSPGANAPPAYVPPSVDLPPLKRGSLEDASAALHAGSQRRGPGDLVGDFSALSEIFSGLVTGTTNTLAGTVGSAVEGVWQGVKDHPGAAMALGAAAWLLTRKGGRKWL